MKIIVDEMPSCSNDCIFLMVTMHVICYKKKVVILENVIC